jgi:hypothetical protein
MVIAAHVQLAFGDEKRIDTPAGLQGKPVPTADRFPLLCTRTVPLVSAKPSKLGE